ncbi:MAG: BrnT family toxin, partial [Pseudobdellovibrio sp.]
FEWDDVKASTNFIKHRISFSEAVTIWNDYQALEIPDPDHSKDEERWVRIGFSNQAKVLVVIYCEKLDDIKIRVISARKATTQEQRQYYEKVNS